MTCMRAWMSSKFGRFDPCGVCLTGVGRTNAVLCDGCKRWVHKKCNAVALRDVCYLRVSSHVPDVLGLLGLLMEDNP